MFVNVLLLLKNIIQIPNFDAAVNGGGENTILIPCHCKHITHHITAQWEMQGVRMS